MVGAAPARLGHFEPAALPLLIELLAQVLPGDGPSGAAFKDQVLLDPCFCPEDLVLAWSGGELIGFCHSVIETLGECHKGWIVALGVRPGYRRKGLGRRLLDHAVERLEAGGCEEVAVSGYEERYLFPGVDRERYPGAPALFQRAGFDIHGSAVAMGRALPTAEGPGPAGYFGCEHPDDGDLPELLALAHSIRPSWGRLLRSYFSRSSDNSRVLIARQGAIAGFAASDVFVDQPGRFGPIGVVAEHRGEGLGSRLLKASLASMSSRGDTRAWFLWAPEDEVGRRMYASAGFVHERRFDLYRRRLARSLTVSGEGDTVACRAVCEEKAPDDQALAGTPRSGAGSARTAIS